LHVVARGTYLVHYVIVKDKERETSGSRIVERERERERETREKWEPF